MSFNKPLFVAVCVLWACLFGALVYVAIHFITKYW